MVEKDTLMMAGALAAILFCAYLVIFRGDAMERCEMRFSHDTCVEMIR